MTPAARPTAAYPPPQTGECILKDFRFACGQVLPEVCVFYRTIGEPRRDAAGRIRNAVLLLHATGGHGGSFLDEGLPGPWFAGELFGPGQPLDAQQYYLIIPDNIGHGRSSRPSAGLRARFPAYRFQDLLAAQYQLVTERLGVEHLRLVMGTSMGGMHTWLWGQQYPDAMDALLPLAALPAQISGRNRMWRQMLSELIRGDPEWQGGDYQTQPRSLRHAAQLLFLMGGNPVLRQQQGPSGEAAASFFTNAIEAVLPRMDANDLLYAIESSRDYNPGPGLERIKAPLLAINFEDDLINPPELGILEHEIRRVPRGRALVLPRTEQSVGHGTHTRAVVWKQHLEEFLRETES